MSLRVFPTPPKHSRRLRRASAASEHFLPLSHQPLQDSMNNKRYALQQTTPLASPTPYASCYAALSHSDREMMLRQQAMDKAQQGDVDSAIALFTQLIDANPNSASHFNNRGLLHFQNGQFQQALRDYQHAIELNPRLGKVYNNRANCYAAFGYIGEAIADYETAIDLDPTDIRARLNLGITLRQLEWYERAIETFDMALQLSQFLNATNTVNIPANVEGHLYAERGRTYQQLGDWNCAVADYHRALENLSLNTYPVSTSHRLRSQVKSWLTELLSPLQD